MLRPFAWSDSDDSEMEAQALSVFRQLCHEGLSPGAAEVIQQSILTALASSGGTVAMHRRFAFAASAMAAPLLIVGAASAATGESPLEAPATVFEAAAASVGLGGNSGDLRQDVDIRSETAGSVGQPGSQRGNTANAPGLQPVGGDDAGAAQRNGEPGSQPEADEPDAQPRANEMGSEPGANETGSELDSDTPDDEGQGNLPAHENDKGCDDVLFAAGVPPFASPGGPGGCEVGNSADHRQNGVKQADDEGQEPPEAPADEPTETIGDDESQGGTSHGLGLGHEEDKPGNGNGKGHTVHGHDPNPNGYGPGGPNDDEAEESATPPDTSAPGGQEPASATPGKSGAAKAKDKVK